jgi:hypothetical protein
MVGRGSLAMKLVLCFNFYFGLLAHQGLAYITILGDDSKSKPLPRVKQREMKTSKARGHDSAKNPYGCL